MLLSSPNRRLRTQELYRASRPLFFVARQSACHSASLLLKKHQQNNMSPTPLANRAATGAATSTSKAGAAGVSGHRQAPSKPRNNNQLALLSLSGALLAAPAAGPAVAAELPPPAPVTQQVQHISSTTAVKFPSVKAPQGAPG